MPTPTRRCWAIKQYAATRINLAQSCNGIGWIFGPIVGSMYFYSKNAAGESTGSETLYIPYVAVAVVVLVLAVIFYFANMPDIKTEDDYHLDDADPGVSHSIWSHPHFVMAVVAQFLYVAAQAGIFSFFINYMTSQVPPIPASGKRYAVAGQRLPVFCRAGSPVVRAERGRCAGDQRPGSRQSCVARIHLLS